MYDPLIYGKNNLERIVCIEPNDGYLEVFQENKDGTVTSDHIQNKYWILSHKPFGKSWVKLKGDLHYKYGIQVSDRDTFQKIRSKYKNEDIFSIYDGKESSMVNKGLTYFKGLKHDEVSCLSFDIESTGLNHDNDSKVLIISNTFRKNGEKLRTLFCYDDYETQADMLQDWCNWVRELDPSLIIGHNIVSYDLPYLQFIADKEGITLNLGRNDTPLIFNKYESFFRIDGSRQQAYRKAKIYGREIIDTMFLSVRYDIGRKYQSYGLKSIINQEGLEVKDRQFYEAGQIRYKYQDPVEWEKIKKYALHDADDALTLYDLMSPSQFYWTQMVPKPYQLVTESATGSQINSIMVRAYLQQGHSIPKADESKPFAGAISFGNPGVYSNMFKIDLNALYPSIIIEYDVYDSDKDPEQYFLKLCKILREQRLNNKKLAKETGNKYYSDMEQSQKIGINSMYGTLGAPGLSFNSPYAAEFITAKGREILKYTIKWATGKEYVENA